MNTTIAVWRIVHAESFGDAYDHRRKNRAGEDGDREDEAESQHRLFWKPPIKMTGHGKCAARWAFSKI
jgi:hypothetical protein